MPEQVKKVQRSDQISDTTSFSKAGEQAVEPENKDKKESTKAGPHVSVSQPSAFAKQNALSILMSPKPKATPSPKKNPTAKKRTLNYPRQPNPTQDPKTIITQAQWDRGEPGTLIIPFSELEYKKPVDSSPHPWDDQFQIILVEPDTLFDPTTLIGKTVSVIKASSRQKRKIGFTRLGAWPWSMKERA